MSHGQTSFTISLIYETDCDRGGNGAGLLDACIQAASPRSVTPFSTHQHLPPPTRYLVQDQNQRWEQVRIILCLTMLTTIGCQTVEDMAGS